MPSLRDRRGQHPDVHPGTLHLQAVPAAIKVVNLNNKYMGMVRQWQEFFHGNRYAESYMDALAGLRQARGILRPRRHEDREARHVEPALKEAFKRKDDLVFLDFITDQTEKRVPMVPGGKGCRK